MAEPTPTRTAPDAGAPTTEGDALDELDAALAEDAPDPEGDGAPGGEPQWTPPSREEWDAQKAALEVERGKLKRARAQAERLRKNGAQPGAQTPVSEGDGAPPAAPDAQTAVWQARAVRAVAKAELLNRGADPDMVELALARLKPAEIEFNDDDEPELEDWLDQTEERYPKLFAKNTPTAPEPARRPGSVDQGRAGAAPPKKLSFGEQVIANSRRAQGRR